MIYLFKIQIQSDFVKNKTYFRKEGLRQRCYGLGGEGRLRHAMTTTKIGALLGCCRLPQTRLYGLRRARSLPPRGQGWLVATRAREQPQPDEGLWWRCFRLRGLINREWPPRLHHLPISF